ncbi:MAG TPA: hypothetical protein VF454_06075 [Gemmatimonadales bacterium]
MQRSRLLAATLPFAFALLASCYGSEPGEVADNNDLIGDPSFAVSVDSLRLSTLAAQGLNLVTNPVLFSMVLDEPLVLWYGRPTPAAAHAMAMRYLQRAMGRETGAAASPVAPMAFRTLAPGSKCVPKITGIGPDSLPRDSDDDGVPDDWKIDYGAGCVDQDILGGHRTTYQGSVEFRDTGLGLKSARAIVKGFRITEEGNEDWGTLINWAEGDETVIFTAVQVTDSLRLVAGQIIPGSSSYFRQDFITTLVPDSGQAVALGTYLPPGSVEVAGEFQIVYDTLDTEDPLNFRMVLSTPTSLHLDLNCGLFEAGKLVGKLNGDSAIRFEATFPGCGVSSEVELFGTTP